MTVLYMSDLMTSPTGLILILSLVVLVVIVAFISVCGRPRKQDVFSKKDAERKFEMFIQTVLLCEDVGESCDNALYWIHPNVRMRIGDGKLLRDIQDFFKRYRVPNGFTITSVKMGNKDHNIEVVYCCECTLDYSKDTGYRVYVEYHQDSYGDGMYCIEIRNLSNKNAKGEHDIGFHVL